MPEVKEPSPTQALSRANECFLLTTLKKNWLCSSNQTVVKTSEHISQSFLHPFNRNSLYLLCARPSAWWGLPGKHFQL